MAKNTNKEYCVVKDCGSSASSHPDLSFHRFPKENKCKVIFQNKFGINEEIDQLKAWKIALKATKIDKRMTVCSLHFKKSDYCFAEYNCLNRNLKRNAVPSCNLPGYNHKLELLKFKRQDNVQKRQEKKDLKDDIGLTGNRDNNKNVIPVSCDFPIDDLDVLNNDLVDQNITNDTNNVITSKVIMDNFFKKKEGVEVQVNTFNLSSFITSDQELSTVTGIESFKVLEVIVDIFKHNYGEKYESEKCYLNTTDRIILTYAKLKLNTSYSFLALMYKITATTCRRIFQTTVQILSKCLKFAIQWPSKDEIAKNLPKCFQDFENTRIVLDCTEIFIQQPKALCCQIMTYSNYKSHLTGKIMVGVTPAGNISFLSDFYGGRVSDSTIFEQSQLKNLLDPNDSIMVDRGFLIDQSCEINRWKLIRPPFLKDKEQFTQEESIMTSKIASARVHVERCNQRIKNFAIARFMSINIVPLINDIFTVICATVNLSAPILSDDKFMETSDQCDLNSVT